MPRPPKVVIFSDRQAADAAVELRTLREALAVTRRREKALSDALKQWFRDSKLEELTVEGIPTLRLRGSDTYAYDVPQLARDNPQLAVQLAVEGILKLQVEQLRKAVSDGRVTEATRPYRTPAPTWSLVFDEEEA